MAEDTTAVYSPAEDCSVEDDKAEPSKKIGRYGGSHDTHFSLDSTAAIETVPIRQT